MLDFLRHSFFRILGRIPLFRRRRGGAEIPEELWEAGFSRPGRTRFDIKSENTYDAYPRGGSLFIGLKKTRCLAWAEGTARCRDMVLKARLRLDVKGGYGAAGIVFRMVDGGTYYLALLSSRGYFRLDAVRNNMPLALIGWTEFEGPGLSANQGAELTVIAFGPLITLLINGSWAGEISDSSIEAGFLGFALASYDAGRDAAGAGDGAGKAAGAPGKAAGAGQGGAPPPGQAGSYAAEAFLDYLSVDTRVAEVEAAWRFWDEGRRGAVSDAVSDIAAGPVSGVSSGATVGAIQTGLARLRLAETFAAMGENAAALGQLKKSWAGGGRREPEALLLAARLAQALGRYDEAEGYADAGLAGFSGGGAAVKAGAGIGRSLAVEKAKILYVRGRYDELKEYAAAAGNGDAALAALLGHAHWETGDLGEAALAYDRAFELDGGNGLHAANAANVYGVMGRRAEALDRSLAAGRAFLRAGNYRDLGILIPKLLNLGPEHWEARALAGKWAFGVENWDEAARECDRAEALGREAGAEKDPALSYLRALLLIRRAKRREALPLLEEAARLAPDYGLFYFRLAENRFLLDSNPADPQMRRDLERALALLDPAAVGETAAAGEKAAAEGGAVAVDTAAVRKGAAAGEKAVQTAVHDESAQTWGWVNNLAAQVSLAGGDPEAAEKFLEEAAAVLGESPPVLVNRAVYQYLRGSLDRALDILDGAGEDPGGDLANCAGNLLVRAGQFEKADLRYQRALAAAPDNPEFLLNRASCLIEMDAYGEADTVLARACRIAPSPAVLELIAYVAVKKGEYPRAETAAKAALELDPGHVPSLCSLGWIYGSTGRWGEAGEILGRLDGLELAGEGAGRREELRRRILEATTRLIPCARCGRAWRVPLDPPPAPFLRLVAMPPDELPAGTCPGCGASYCIGCAKEHLDGGGRFTCPACGKPLKLINEGLKKIVADWAAGAMLGHGEAPD
jgi:tetratricopeptide (TPR) repeat protein